ncbi:MAG: D-alanyl-D-alanine carboxypeptidase/D-alanyl-D-alanine-endopeptidase [Planctomycetes bacterium]|nr:D-alanyl-D-alanine carboxypeptidase/D-alanyl-D-alanine-endopeptidase [Planctomycetota bacterium]
MRKFQKVSLILCLSVLSAIGVGAENIGSILRNTKNQKAKFAIYAVRASDGKELYSYNAAEAMMPASNMKLITTAAAVHYLNADYVFRTEVGLWNGNLVVIGQGDPLFGDAQTDQNYNRRPGWIFDTIISALKQNKIQSISDIVVDASFFDNNRVHSAWPVEQLNQPYACEISGLNYNNNCIHVAAKKQNGRPLLEITPSTSYITLINQIRSVGSGGSAVGAYRNSRPNVMIVKGNLNKQTEFDVTIEKPSAFFAWLLKERLTQAGIEVRGNLLQQYVKKEPGIRTLHTFETPLSDVLGRCNKDSLGLAAESLVKTISAENTEGRINGEWPHGLKRVGRYLQSLGADPNLFNLDDGSGLSRNNRLTPRIIVSVLRDVYGSPNWKMFEASLSVGGEDGTTVKYFHDPPYKGNILGKTGYISGVRAFSGICKTPEGDILFSILTEKGGSSVRKAINDITEAIFDCRF